MKWKWKWNENRYEKKQLDRTNSNYQEIILQVLVLWCGMCHPFRFNSAVARAGSSLCGKKYFTEVFQSQTSTRKSAFWLRGTEAGVTQKMSLSWRAQTGVMYNFASGGCNSADLQFNPKLQGYNRNRTYKFYRKLQANQRNRYSLNNCISWMVVLGLED